MEMFGDMTSIHEKLYSGELPKHIFIVDWSDITQIESLQLGSDAQLFRFNSAGCIVKVTKDKIDLQQTWEVKDNPHESVTVAKTANLLLSLPKGVVRHIYVYELVGEMDTLKKKTRKKSK